MYDQTSREIPGVQYGSLPVESDTEERLSALSLHLLGWFLTSITSVTSQVRTVTCSSVTVTGLLQGGSHGPAELTPAG